jgi:hypothetical protein
MKQLKHDNYSKQTPTGPTDYKAITEPTSQGHADQRQQSQQQELKTKHTTTITLASTATTHIIAINKSTQKSTQHIHKLISFIISTKQQPQSLNSSSNHTPQLTKSQESNIHNLHSHNHINNIINKQTIENQSDQPQSI